MAAAVLKLDRPHRALLPPVRAWEREHDHRAVVVGWAIAERWRFMWIMEQIKEARNASHTLGDLDVHGVGHAGVGCPPMREAYVLGAVPFKGVVG